MPRYDGKSQFIKAARARLDDGFRLLERNEGARVIHTRGAMYLGGYALECALKVYIIQSERANTLTEAVDRLRQKERGRQERRRIPDLATAAGHRLSLLLALTNLEGQIEHGSTLWRQLQLSFQWQSNWRYDPTQPSEEDARTFLTAV